MLHMSLPERRMGGSPFCLHSSADLRLPLWIVLAALAATCATSALCQAPASAPAPEKTVRIPASVANGMLVHKVDPVVPADANGPEAVVLRATISPSGDVEDVQLISRPTDAAKTIIDAVMQWKYTRPVLGGVPVKVQAPIIVALGPADTALTDQQLSDNAAEEMKAGNFEAALDLAQALQDRYSYAKDVQSQTKLPRSTLNLLRTTKEQVQSALIVQQYFEQTGIRVKAIGNRVTAPTLTRRVDPEFPASAERGSDVTLLINMIVDTSGVPQAARVIKSADSAFDDAALRAVKQYRFKPAMEDGNPVAVLLNVQVSFTKF